MLKQKEVICSYCHNILNTTRKSSVGHPNRLWNRLQIGLALVVGVQLYAFTTYAMRPLLDSQAKKPETEVTVALSGTHNNSPSTGTHDAAKMSREEIQAFLCDFTEQKSEALGWTETWDLWRQVFHAASRTRTPRAQLQARVIYFD